MNYCLNSNVCSLASTPVTNRRIALNRKYSGNVNIMSQAGNTRWFQKNGRRLSQYLSKETRIHQFMIYLFNAYFICIMRSQCFCFNSRHNNYHVQNYIEREREREKYLLIWTKRILQTTPYLIVIKLISIQFYFRLRTNMW